MENVTKDQGTLCAGMEPSFVKGLLCEYVNKAQNNIEYFDKGWSGMG